MSRGPASPARDLRTRPMTEGDVGTLLALEAECHPDPWTPGMLRDSLAQGHYCRVLELDGAICGHAVLQVAAGEAELLNLCVARACRRQGLGSAFLDRLMALAHEAGAANMFLEVRASNRAAIRLYAAHGFHQVGRRPHYYRLPNGHEDALVMARHLSTGEPYPQPG